MNIVLSEEMQQELTNSLLHVVEGYLDSLQFESKEKQPFLSRKKAAEWFGVSPMTLDAWVKAGAPVAVVNGYKMYGKEPITQWLADHQITNDVSGK